jgi:hypothetical protein
MRAGRLCSSAFAVWLATALGVAEGAWGQAPSALSWVREAGAESCIGAPELGARVERLVGPVLVAAPSAEVSVEGHIARHGQRFVAKIVISDAHGAVLGERQIESARAARGAEPDCRALDDQLAFVIAVAIDPNVALAELPGELAPDDAGADLLATMQTQPRAAPAETAAAPAAAVAPPEELERGEPERLRLLAAAGPTLGFGALPSTAAGLHVDFGAALGRFALRGHLRLLLDQEETSREARVELSSLALGLAGCVEPVRWHVSFELCGGVQAARLEAQALDLPGDPVQEWLLGPRLELRASRALAEHFALVLSAALVSHFPKHSVSYTAARVAREVFAVPSVSAELQLLLEMRF